MLLKPLGITSACLAVVQGLTWTVLSLLTILIHFEAWTVTVESDTHKDLLSGAILFGYILGDEGFGTFANVFIKPKHFYVWAILFLIISVFWVAVSGYLLSVLLRNQYGNFKKSILAWGIWTIVVCAGDVLLTSILFKDYTVLLSVYNSNKNLPNLYFLLACAVVMSISGKGFVLWLVNVALSVVMLIVYSRLEKNLKPPQSEFQRIPRKSDRMENQQSFRTFHGLPRVAPVQTTNEEVTNRHGQNDFVFSSRRDNLEYFMTPQFEGRQGL